MQQSEMHTITKREITERVAKKTDISRALAKRVMEQLFDEIIEELSHGNRIEFRDFGVYEIKTRAAHQAKNPRTLAPVFVPEKRNAKFKPGRRMRDRIDAARPVPLIEPKTSIAPHTHNLGSHAQVAQAQTEPKTPPKIQSQTLGTVGPAAATQNHELPRPQRTTG